MRNVPDPSLRIPHSALRTPHSALDYFSLAFRLGFAQFIAGMSEAPTSRTPILNAQAIHRVLTRIAHEIAERNDQSQSVVVVGVQRGGIHLADRLGMLLKGIWGHAVPVGCIDVSM